MGQEKSPPQYSELTESFWPVGTSRWADAIVVWIWRTQKMSWNLGTAMGCQPELHSPMQTIEQYKTARVGQQNQHRRRQMLSMRHGAADQGDKQYADQQITYCELQHARQGLVKIPGIGNLDTTGPIRQRVQERGGHSFFVE
jgi:hypothetical protein